MRVQIEPLLLATDALAGSAHALAVVSKAPLAASLVPYRLSHPQAQQLIALLQRATGAQGGA